MAEHVKSVTLAQAREDDSDAEGLEEEEELVISEDEILRDERGGRKKNGIDLDTNSVIAALDNLQIISSGERASWVSAIRRQEHDALIAILVLSLPNLETLSIYLEPQEEENTFLHNALKNAIHTQSVSSSSPFFKMLKHVDYDWGFQETAMGIVDHFFYIPSIRTLSIRSLSLYNFSWVPSLSSSNIEELNFSSNWMDASAWAALLAPLKSLKKLNYSTGHPSDDKIMGLNPAGLVNALSTVNNTLETLKLEAFFLNGGEEDFLGSLQHFRRLKRVVVQLALLIGTENSRGSKMLWELLPSSLETLNIWDARTGGGNILDREDAIAQIMEFVLRKETEFPLLKHVAITSGFGSVKELSKVCRKNGIEFHGLIW
ncbi:hypothetical protein BP6252_10809 [Coleophoma cylindrospora]|uniref:Leucine-rich repeat domain-containing protein n=1 Tax=Coleophoma cylindrospora TaxID=1849047 RepID=A0A3D8QP89_9HELO|nr:hypothetical protein BP6252_10809 [Coleophoma cylindrospora]